ncbi:hypothetical protein E1A91_A01G226600v1 [Gossypium mustelinum]|uniref:Nucleoplasmin-like domain-containing protein n=1 Tax=Gossypium mustelinum TaxID=34275 RepID=A0A5D3AGD9_GOSMU|nr:hypothetical protein E1A91_A01G226600v1 [Gossypium mustelinum]
MKVINVNYPIKYQNEGDKYIPLFVVGTLSQKKCPQIALDLALHDKFELFHTWKNSSVYVTGYYVDTSQGSDTEFEEELPEPIMNLVKSKPVASYPTTTKQVKIVELKKDNHSNGKWKKASGHTVTPPTPKKKTKLVTPQKTIHSGADDKKASGHTTIPHTLKKKANLVTPQKTSRFSIPSLSF